MKMLVTILAEYDVTDWVGVDPENPSEALLGAARILKVIVDPAREDAGDGLAPAASTPEQVVQGALMVDARRDEAAIRTMRVFAALDEAGYRVLRVGEDTFPTSG